MTKYVRENAATETASKASTGKKIAKPAKGASKATAKAAKPAKATKAAKRAAPTGDRQRYAGRSYKVLQGPAVRDGSRRAQMLALVRKSNNTDKLLGTVQKTANGETTLAGNDIAWLIRDGHIALVD